MHDSRGSWIEGVIARGDRSLADAIEGAYRRGARFDSWEEQLDLDAWDAAFEEAQVDPARFLGTLPVSARLPWEHIDVGLGEGFLQKEYRKALRNRLSPPCGKAVGMFVHHTNLTHHEADRRKLVCYDCGVACDMTAMHERRGELLLELGARKPRPAEADTTPPAVLAPKGRRRPPERPDQGEPLRIRLRFEKLGRAACASHLDLVRLLPRLLRRLELPIYYSRGFNPRPLMTFGPALSLGVASLAEYVEIKLAEGSQVDCAHLPTALSETSIDGIRFVEATALAAGDPKLNQAIEEAVYVAALPRTVMQELGLSEVALQEQLQARRQQPLSARRNIDGIGKKVDVGRFLMDAQVGDPEDALGRAGLCGDLTAVTLRLRITGAGTAKASEALGALLQAPQLPVRFVRSALLFRHGGAAHTPMALDVLRDRAAAEKEARRAEKAAAAEGTAP